MSKRLEYEQFGPGITSFEMNAKGEKMRFACCDCGLVHWIAIALEKNGKIGVSVRRNVAATTARRRWMKEKA